MKQNLSPQTSSFIVLTSICFFGGFLVILISSQLLKNVVYVKTAFPEIQKTASALPENNLSLASAQEPVLPDTSDWEPVSLKPYNISFKLPKTWKLSGPKTKNGFDVISIDPGKKFYNIELYISQTGYYAMDGLPAVRTIVGGMPALNVSNLLYGIYANGHYFTFDAGRSLSLTPEFNAIVKSVEFNK